MLLWRNYRKGLLVPDFTPYPVKCPFRRTNKPFRVLYVLEKNFALIKLFKQKFSYQISENCTGGFKHFTPDHIRKKIDALDQQLAKEKSAKTETENNLK